MNIKNSFMVLCFLITSLSGFTQHYKSSKDSLYIQEIENYKKPDKVLHAEPLYIDLIRDLGARKGEKNST